MANRSLTAAKAAAAAKLRLPAPNQAAAVGDMYSNQAANIGWATTSAVNAGRHIPFRISLDYQKLVFMYRGSWVIRQVIDTKPQDQLKQFPTLLCDVTPEDISDFEKVVASTATLQKYIEGRKWGRLFGGALGIIIIKGDNDLTKPLRIEDVEPDTYRGLIIVDRWSGMSPSSELITDLNNPSEYGLPVYYDVYTEANQSLKVHHSRCLRFVGRDLPLFEKQIETYWGMSEVEAILDELQRYDFGMAAVSDLISRANVLAMKEPMLAQMLSGLNLTQQQLVDYAARMTAVSEAISTNGILALGEDGELFSNTYSFSGLSEVMKMQMTALCGAADYPFSRLFGDTQTGLGQSNEGDLQNYYDSADQERRQKDRPLFDKLIPIIAMSTWGEVPDDLDYAFPPIRTMNSKEKAELAKSQGDTIKGYFDSGILGRQTILREIKTLSAETGIGSNVTDEMIEAADDDVQVPLQIEAEEARAGTEEFSEGKTGTEAKETKGGKDSWFARAWKRIAGARDAEFVESEHPRDDDGKFSESGSSTSSSTGPYLKPGISTEQLQNTLKQIKESHNPSSSHTIYKSLIEAELEKRGEPAKPRAPHIYTVSEAVGGEGVPSLKTLEGFGKSVDNNMRDARSTTANLDKNLGFKPGASIVVDVRKRLEMPAGSTIEDVISNPEKRDELTAFLQKKSAETFHEWQLEIKRRPSYSPDRPTATEYEKMRDMCHYRALLGNWASKAYPKEKTAKE